MVIAFRSEHRSYGEAIALAVENSLAEVRPDVEVEAVPLGRVSARLEQRPSRPVVLVVEYERPGGEMGWVVLPVEEGPGLTLRPECRGRRLANPTLPDLLRAIDEATNRAIAWGGARDPEPDRKCGADE